MLCLALRGRAAAGSRGAKCARDDTAEVAPNRDAFYQCLPLLNAQRPLGSSSKKTEDVRPPARSPRGRPFGQPTVLGCLVRLIFDVLRCYLRC